jgi:hypothetical protein
LGKPVDTKPKPTENLVNTEDEPGKSQTPSLPQETISGLDFENDPRFEAIFPKSY